MAQLSLSRPSRGLAAELRSLEAELDPELKAEGLFHLARRAEARGEGLAAFQIYQLLKDTSLSDRAVDRLKALEGGGRFGDQAEDLLRSFSRDALEPSSLAAMGAAGALFKATRLLALSGLVSSPASIFTRGFGARALAATAGFAVEAPAFPLVARLSRQALGHSQDWSLPALGREVFSSALVLGGMKLGGFASTSLAARIGPAGVSTFARGAIQQSGMLGGILLGHRFEELAGLRQASPTNWAETFATLLQFNLAARFTKAAFGERFGRWEREMEIRAAETAPPIGNFPLFPQSERKLAMVGPSEIPAEKNVVRPPVLMMAGGLESSGRRLPAPVEIAFLQLRNPDLGLAESHLFYLEYLLYNDGPGLRPREYVDVYNRLRRELKDLPHGLNKDATTILTETLSRANLDHAGPRHLFKEMIHIDRFGDYSLGDTLVAWARNHSLQSRERRKLLQLADDIFEGKPSTLSEEALSMMANAWLRLRVENRAFQRALNSAIRFLSNEEAWFQRRFNGIGFAEAALLDPDLSERSRDLILNQMQQALHNTRLGSAIRVEVISSLERLLQRSDLNEDQRHIFESRLPIWRNDLLHFVEKSSRENRLNHYAELAYLLTQDDASLVQKRRFAQELQKAFFSARPESPAYSLMFADALRYYADPRLTPEFRQTFVMQMLKALKDSTEYAPHPYEIEAHRMNQRFIVEKIASLPDEERIALANHLIDELGRRDGRGQRALVLMDTLASLINPTDHLRRRLAEGSEKFLSNDARQVAQAILQRWERIN